jgi:anti-sigma B factor antagonist
MIDITSRDAEDIKVVDIEGKLNTGASPDAEAFINDLIDEGATKILLNLEELDFISSTGLRVILATGKKLSEMGGKLVLCSPNHTVSDVFRMSGFNQMFSVLDTEAEALKNFQG